MIYQRPCSTHGQVWREKKENEYVYYSSGRKRRRRRETSTHALTSLQHWRMHADVRARRNNRTREMRVNGLMVVPFSLFLLSTRKNRSTESRRRLPSDGKSAIKSWSSLARWQLEQSRARRIGDKVIVSCSSMTYHCIVRMTEMFLFILSPWSS